MLHLPLLRRGRPYRSLETMRLDDVRTGEPVATVSMANRGLVGHDVARRSEGRAALERIPARELLAICRRAADAFARGSLPVDPENGACHTPEDYVRALSATTGMPHVLCAANMEKIRFVLAEMETVLGGLTRGLDLRVLDEGWVHDGARPVSYLRQADALGAVLPSNSPGVHSLWLPAIALKVALVLRPGRQEPWTPMRVCQALLEAGCPPAALGFYPSDHAAAEEILLRCERSMFFGDAGSVRAWSDDPRVQIHGPGWSKVLIGDDEVGRWPAHLDLLARSVSENGGRSCVNASGIWVTGHAREIAEALAERLAAIEALPLDDPRAALAAFSDPAVAHRVSALVDAQLAVPGAIDLTARFRPGGRIAEVDGCTFLLPTVVLCEDPQHPLAATELLFPFVSVVEVPQAELVARIGPTLVATLLSDDPRLRAELMASRDVDRLNLGPLPTCRVAWDQPHEGNLFEHLYRQRAFYAEPLAPGAPAA